MPRRQRVVKRPAGRWLRSSSWHRRRAAPQERGLKKRAPYVVAPSPREFAREEIANLSSFVVTAAPMVQRLVSRIIHRDSCRREDDPIGANMTAAARAVFPSPRWRGEGAEGQGRVKLALAGRSLWSPLLRAGGGGWLGLAPIAGDLRGASTGQEQAENRRALQGCETAAAPSKYFMSLGGAEMAPEYYDELEISDPETRERAQLARVVETVSRAKAAPGWARQLGRLDPATTASRAGLAKLPLLRKSELPALQRADPPLGGFNVTSPDKMCR